MTSDTDVRHLRRCLELATEALEAGDEPFGSVLVAADGTVLAEARNHVGSGDPTRHPEFRAPSRTNQLCARSAGLSPLDARIQKPARCR